MSKYDLKKPCDNCPFRRGKKAIKLTEGRLYELTDLMLNPGGGEFVCHKTTVNDDGERVGGINEQHCAGALIFAYKNDNATQMMRIAERFGGLNPDNLEDWDDIYDDREEMVEEGQR